MRPRCIERRPRGELTLSRVLIKAAGNGALVAFLNAGLAALSSVHAAPDFTLK
ncbi:hypothetical protein [Pectobacterium parmentieri]|uniref:hypothetical protein n=1 Tax=Pectobacterium parmentieri TaxID=1905730 RepID=UPI002B2548B9|nr:hypothetical protein [Pectobacterium parmentieri]